MAQAEPTQDQVFPVRPDVAAAAHIDAAGYRRAFDQAKSDPEAFWAEAAKRVAWITPPTKIKNTSFDGDVSIKWFEDGVLNASVSCVDRHLAANGDSTAIIWEGDDPEVSRRVTYRELHDQVCRLANGLKSLGVQRGDVVTIYLPMVPEAAVAMLACARIGAVHSVVFGGSRPTALPTASRIVARNC